MIMSMHVCLPAWMDGWMNGYEWFIVDLCTYVCMYLTAVYACKIGGVMHISMEYSVLLFIFDHMCTSTYGYGMK